MRIVHSPVDGTPYRIFLAWPDFLACPEERAPERGFPAIFLLDANASFLTMVESLRMRARRQASTGIAPAVIVGIGYDTDGSYDPNRRIYDFSLPHTQDTPRNGPPRRTGGAIAFADFIQSTVKPLVASELPVDPERLALAGHSMGAYFTLSQLLLAPMSFETFIAISPSIWWDENWLQQESVNLPQRLRQDAPPRRALITVGEYEQALAPWQRSMADTARIEALRGSRAMIDRTRAFAQRLAAQAGQQLIVRMEELTGEDHASSVPIGISHGLRFALWEGAALLRNVNAGTDSARPGNGM